MPPITVEIEIDDQGKITVGTESAEQPTSGMAGAEPREMQGGTGEGEQAGEDSAMRPVKSIEEALQVAGDLLRNAPQVQDADGQAGFEQVFGKQPSPGAVS